MLSFRLSGENTVEILLKGKVVGHIFSPGANLEGNTIQVCGFDKAHTLWGCAIFHGKDGPKQDIQFVFNEDSTREHDEDIRRHDWDFNKICSRCFHSFRPYTDKGMQIGKLVECGCDKLKLYMWKDIRGQGLPKGKEVM